MALTKQDYLDCLRHDVSCFFAAMIANNPEAVYERLNNVGLYNLGTNEAMLEGLNQLYSQGHYADLNYIAQSPYLASTADQSLQSAVNDIMSRTAQTRALSDWDWAAIAGALGAAGALIGGLAGAGDGDGGTGNGAANGGNGVTTNGAQTNWGRIIMWVLIALFALGLVLLMIRLIRRRA